MSSYSAKYVFSSAFMKQEVKEVEKSLRFSCYSTLLDAFVIPTNSSEKKINPHVLQKAKIDFVTNPNPQYTDYGLGYDIKATNSYMKDRKALLEIPCIRELLNEEKPDVRDLQRASLFALKPMQAFAFKLLVLSHTGMKKHFWGMMPFTTQVRKATKFLFNEEHKDQWQHTVLCFNLAKELNTYPLYINSALWVIGDREL